MTFVTYSDHFYYIEPQCTGGSFKFSYRHFLNKDRNNKKLQSTFYIKLVGVLK
jgi:hypothetical protein